MTTTISNKAFLESLDKQKELVRRLTELCDNGQWSGEYETLEQAKNARDTAKLVLLAMDLFLLRENRR